MSDNRGFTLIELLAVIAILTTVSFIAVFGITRSLDKRYDKECEEQKALARNAAKIYFSMHEVNSITINELIENGYFSEESKYDKLQLDTSVFKVTKVTDEYTEEDIGKIIYNYDCKP